MIMTGETTVKQSKQHNQLADGSATQEASNDKHKPVTGCWGDNKSSCGGNGDSSHDSK